MITASVMKGLIQIFAYVAGINVGIAVGEDRKCSELKELHFCIRHSLVKYVKIISLLFSGIQTFHCLFIQIWLIFYYVE